MHSSHSRRFEGFTVVTAAICMQEFVFMRGRFLCEAAGPFPRAQWLELPCRSYRDVHAMDDASYEWSRQSLTIGSGVSGCFTNPQGWLRFT